MAAAVLHAKATSSGAPIQVASAGTADYHVGEGPNPLAQQVWQDAGYDYSHVARQFTTEMFASHDLVLVMDESNRANVLRLAQSDGDRAKVRYLRAFDPALRHLDPIINAQALSVPDPWGGPRQGFDDVLTMVEAAVDGLLADVT